METTNKYSFNIGYTVETPKIHFVKSVLKEIDAAKVSTDKKRKIGTISGKEQIENNLSFEICNASIAKQIANLLGFEFSADQEFYIA